MGMDIRGAAKFGNIKEMKRLLALQDIQVNQVRRIDGGTPLIIAAYKGHSEVVKLLLDKKDIQVNQGDRCGATPLIHAAKKGHLEVVKLLLERDNIHVNQGDKYGYTPLSLAAMQGRSELLKLLLEKDDIQVNQGDIWGDTPLYKAVIGGHREIIKLLQRERNILVGKANNRGLTPLSVAEAQANVPGHPHNVLCKELFELLLEKAKEPLNETETCLVCMDHTPDVVLIPCGHQNMCGACAHQWGQEKMECPSDRIPISKIIPIHD